MKKTPEKPGFFVYHACECPHGESEPEQTQTIEKTSEEIRTGEKAQKQRIENTQQIQSEEKVAAKLNSQLDKILKNKDLLSTGEQWILFKDACNKKGINNNESTSDSLKQQYKAYAEKYKTTTKRHLSQISTDEKLKLFHKDSKLILSKGLLHLSATDIFDSKKHSYIQKGDIVYKFNKHKRDYRDSEGNRLSLGTENDIKIDDQITLNTNGKQQIERYKRIDIQKEKDINVLRIAPMCKIIHQKDGESKKECSKVELDKATIAPQLYEIFAINNPVEKKERLTSFLQAIEDIVQEQSRESNINVNKGTSALINTIILQDPTLKKGFADVVFEKQPDGKTFIYDTLGIDGLQTDTRLGVMTFNEHEYIRITLKDGTTKTAVKTKVGEVLDYHYINDNGEITKVELLNNTRFKLIEAHEVTMEEHQAFIKKKMHVTNNTANDALLLNDQMQSDSGRMKAYLDGKEFLSSSEQQLYEQVTKEWNNQRLHNAIPPTKNEFTESGYPPTLELNEEDKQDISNQLAPLGVSSDQVIGMNPDGTYKIRLENSPATFNYDEIENQIQIKTGGDDTQPLTFRNSEQSQFGVNFVAEMAHYGNSDILDYRKSGSPDIQNIGAQFENKMNDLFPSDGAQYFDDEHAQEIANTCFHMGGASFFEIITDLQIVDEETNTNESLVNNDSSASALNRMDIKPNAFSKNRYTIQNFLYNMGERSINASDIIASKENNNGKIVINKKGRLV